MKISTRLTLMVVLLLAQLSALAATVTIEVGDNYYSPENVTINPGDVVVWRNVGSGVHPTVSETSAWSTFIISPSNTTSTISSLAAGTTYKYYCSAHSFVSNGTRQGMIGSITVRTVATPTLAARDLAPTLSVYPNPSRGLVTVSVSQLSAKSDLKLRLNNIIGREIRTVAVRPEAADGGMSINLSDLPAGMYFYSLVQNDKVLATKRLILQN
ncbi:T9SS type A sorting domain-containing protein [Hymenobacter rigui]|uniref:T9SS C-terminal target domain-containing protein n=1 Tax=Hymenobacter rigui TaxID=334424 RepID=A0A428KX60_9BACT|nr:T9SS type A sorting domain-containing protein [Hymenobacter rigui]RSK51356.1 T9SS C-terminal target domain-containing protein [Hymenobacter rigui]